MCSVDVCESPLHPLHHGRHVRTDSGALAKFFQVVFDGGQSDLSSPLVRSGDVIDQRPVQFWGAPRSVEVRTHDRAVYLRLACYIREAIAKVCIHSWRDMILPKHSIEGRLLRDSPRVLVICVSEEEEKLRRGFVTHGSSLRPAVLPDHGLDPCISGLVKPDIAANNLGRVGLLGPKLIKCRSIEVRALN